MNLAGPLPNTSVECERVLRSVPRWFGIEEALRAYVQDADRWPTFHALESGGSVGFITLRQHFPASWEIHCMAVLGERRGQGIGRRLHAYVERWLLTQGASFLQVKTLADLHPSTEYAETRAFYASLGYTPHEVFPTLWGAKLPVLQLVKTLCPPAVRPSSLGVKVRYPTPLDDRFAGAMLGLACGDAIGATTEFLERDTFEPVLDMVGGGVYELAAGLWTDDTSMAMCLAESLLASDVFDPVDQMSRYLSWYRNGYWSSLPHCFDIGQTTEYAIKRFEKTRDPWCGPTHHITAGNGSVMRLAPVVLRYFPDESEVLYHAAESSRTTHGAVLAVEGCRLLAYVLLQLLRGAAKDECLEGSARHVSRAQLRRIAEGAFRRKPRSRIKSSGFVVHTLEAALWCLHRTSDLEEAILLAANLGDDADTVAAVTGQLAGAHYGASRIPDRWLRRLYRRDDIETLALCLRR